MKLKLHHVGMLVSDIPAMKRLYQDRFGYHPDGDIIHDSVQTAYVQFMKLPNDSSYLEFISPDGPNSKLQRALSQGIGLHHLCYETDAIDECSAELRGRGMSLIQRPVGAVAFQGRRIAWLMGRDRVLIELVEAELR